MTARVGRSARRGDWPPRSRRRSLSCGVRGSSGPTGWRPSLAGRARPVTRYSEDTGCTAWTGLTVRLHASFVVTSEHDLGSSCTWMSRSWAEFQKAAAIADTDATVGGRLASGVKATSSFTPWSTTAHGWLTQRSWRMSWDRPALPSFDGHSLF